MASNLVRISGFCKIILEERGQVFWTVTLSPAHMGSLAHSHRRDVYSQHRLACH